MFSITAAWQKPFLNAMIDALNMPLTQSYWIWEHANLPIMHELMLYEGHSYQKGNCLPKGLTVAVQCHGALGMSLCSCSLLLVREGIYLQEISLR